MDQATKLRALLSERSQDLAIPVRSSRVIAISSGKGGVGKTNFAINIAIQLRRANYKVILIDADFALANIEVLYGVSPKYSIADVLNGNMSIVEVLTEGPLGVQFISGGTGVRELVKMSDAQMKALISNFSQLDDIADVILIDTGAGVTPNVTNFIRAAGEVIIVTTPEPTSITDSYSLIKILRTESAKESVPLIKILVNRVEDDKEGVEIFTKLKNVSQRFLSIDVEFLGCLPSDAQLVKAVKRQEPVTVSYPNSRFSKSIEQISIKLISNIDTPDTTHKGFGGFIKRLVNIFNG